jgi:ElaB/YqjD/DUF883 family membrane-anchored ribosome-binding protein
MKRSNHQIQESAANLAEDAQELLAATANVAETKVIEARKRLSAALDRGKEAWGQAQDYAVEKAKAADEVIRDHPYHSIGIAFGVGALLGLLMSRRSS